MARKKRLDNKGRVLRTGEQQRAEDNRYLYRYTDLAGKKKTVYASTLQELREKEQQIERDLQDGIDTIKGEMTLNELFRVYMDTKTDLRERTRCSYYAIWENGIEHSALGNMKIANIKQLHIRAFYSELAARGLAENTIKTYHTLICPALEMAADSDIIRKNPAAGCGKNISGSKKERVALSRKEQAALVEYIDQDERFACYAPMIEFALETGLRVGELAGLRWADCDLKNNIIHIRQQLMYTDLGDGYKFHFGDLKTAAGRRDIPLTQAARKCLIRQKELIVMTGRAGKIKEIEGVSDFVFTNSQGGPFSTSLLNQVLINTVDSFNSQGNGLQLPHISAHILRHTACSRFAESGLDAKTLQYIMGHADIKITLDTYTHLDFSQIQKNMNDIQENLKIG